MGKDDSERSTLKVAWIGAICALIGAVLGVVGNIVVAIITPGNSFTFVIGEVSQTIPEDEVENFVDELGIIVGTLTYNLEKSDQDLRASQSEYTSLLSEKNQLESDYSVVVKELDELQKKLDQTGNQNTNRQKEIDDLTVKIDNLQKKIQQIALYANIQIVDGEPVLGAKKSLTTYSPIKSNNWYINDGSLIDSLGTQYTSNTQYILTKHDKHYGAGDSWAEILINGEFCNLKGKIVAHESMERDANASIRILVDKGITGMWEEVYPKTELEITRKTDPFNIDVSLGSDVKYVRIETYGQSMLLLNFIFYNDSN